MRTRLQSKATQIWATDRRRHSYCGPAASDSFPSISRLQGRPWRGVNERRDADSLVRALDQEGTAVVDFGHGKVQGVTLTIAFSLGFGSSARSGSFRRGR